MNFAEQPLPAADVDRAFDGCDVTIRGDEAEEAWRVFEPVLDALLGMGW